ncbi:MAG TPA: SPASM domain-containing protein [Anaerolineae bacterium]|nr:SPASM domain-containing protein [Anaerolineae bacterium]
MDGPPSLHDQYRVDKGGRPTFDRVARGLEILREHGVEYNVLTCVHRRNGDHPLEVYRFLKSLGARFIQFIPIVECASPTSGAATPTSVGAEQYGHFLTSVFDEWLYNDVGQVFVQIFDVALGIWTLGQASLCVFAETCGRALALEHNGDLFSCDHFVTPEHRLGNLMDVSLVKMVNSPQQQRFGQAKPDSLPAYCRACVVRFACNGGCPKNRFALTPEGEPGLNYLCPGYQHFFHHIAPAMQRMTAALRAGKPAASVMPQLRAGKELLATNA